ncbi:MAG: hypothetical protein U1E26_00875 [Coriobacteriia bacterium]|nr:hypothetical protein [Coriobacteriia bacterium]
MGAIRRLVRLVLSGVLVGTLLPVSAPARAVPPAPARTAASVAPGVAVDAPTVQRLSGSSAAARAAALSKGGWARGSGVVIIAPSRSPLYAAIAAPLSTVLDAPILLADSTLPASTAKEIARLKATKAIVVGSTAVVGGRVSASLAARRVSVTRLSGAGVDATARVVAGYIDRRRNVTGIVVAPASTIPALVAAGEAARLRRPLLFASSKGLYSSSRAAITSLDPTAALVVGTTSALPSVVTTQLKSLKVTASRVSGTSSRSIARVLAERAVDAGYPLEEVSVASDSSAAYLLTAPSFAARSRTPLLLSGNTVSSAAAAVGFVRAHGSAIRRIRLIGPASVLPSAVSRALVEAGTTRIAEDAEVIAGEAAATVAGVTDQAVTFSSPSTLTASLVPGDVIVSGPTTEAPEGFLREVTGVTQSGSGVRVMTQPAQLVDVIGQGSIDLQRELSPETVVSGKAMRPGVSASSVDAAALSKSFDLALDDVVVYDADGDESTKADQVKLNGSIEFTAEVDAHADISWFTLKTFEFTTKVSEKAEVKVSSSVSASLSKRVELYRWKLAPMTVNVGPVPVVFVPEVSVYAGADGRISVGVSAGAVQQASYKVGVRYDSGNWSPISERSSSFTYQPPTLTASADARVYAGAHIALMLYGIAGPDASVEAFVKAHADPRGDPLWELRGGLRAEAGAKVEVFNKTLAQWHTTVFEWEKVLAKQAAPAPPPLPDFVYAKAVMPEANGWTVMYRDGETNRETEVYSGFSKGGAPLMEWSPDGRYLAMRVGAGASVWGLFLYRMVGDRLVEVAANTGEWSGIDSIDWIDNSRLLLDARQGWDDADEYSWRIYDVTRDAVTDAPLEAGGWVCAAPAASRLFQMTYRNVMVDENGLEWCDETLVRHDTVTNARTDIRTVRKTTQNGTFGGRASPDGSLVDVVWKWGIQVVDYTGQLLLSTEDGHQGAAWSPDSQELATRGPNDDVYIINPRTGARRRVFAKTGVHGLAWLKSGNRLAYTTGSSWDYDTTNKLWVVGADGAGERLVMSGKGLSAAWRP